MSLLLLLACGDPDPCAGTRDLTRSPAALTLTAEEHGVGWGQEQCFQCHQAWNIHSQDCIGGVEVEEIEADPEDPSTCVPCHGDNGVEALRVDTGEGE
ncbi:MAG TPA: hypothetical protein QGF58_05985 [Myxococcota bacterium]|nr:hypothetical protein [Myxococcota bacterium]